MANGLGEDIKPGTLVVLRKIGMAKGYKNLKWRIFEARGGFGMQASTIGTALYGRFMADGEEARWDARQVKRIATDEYLKALK